MQIPAGAAPEKDNVSPGRNLIGPDLNVSQQNSVKWHENRLQNVKSYITKYKQK